MHLTRSKHDFHASTLSLVHHLELYLVDHHGLGGAVGHDVQEGEEGDGNAVDGVGEGVVVEVEGVGSGEGDAGGVQGGIVGYFEAQG